MEFEFKAVGKFGRGCETNGVKRNERQKQERDGETFGRLHRMQEIGLLLSYKLHALATLRG